MIRVAGVVLSEYKHVDVALTGIYGIGRAAARRICASAGIEPAQRLGKLPAGQLEHLREKLSTFKRDEDDMHPIRIEGDLRREVSMNIKRLIDMGSYRGIRHRSGLPVRGQRTRTNARTRKGPRKVKIKK
jgi:small subunit ribosomal protein S13